MKKILLLLLIPLLSKAETKYGFGYAYTNGKDGASHLYESKDIMFRIGFYTRLLGDGDYLTDYLETGINFSDLADHTTRVQSEYIKIEPCNIFGINYLIYKSSYINFFVGCGYGRYKTGIQVEEKTTYEWDWHYHKIDDEYSFVNYSKDVKHKNVFDYYSEIDLKFPNSTNITPSMGFAFGYNNRYSSYFQLSFSMYFDDSETPTPVHFFEVNRGDDSFDDDYSDIDRDEYF
jgi:hypothetical protein